MCYKVNNERKVYINMYKTNHDDLTQLIHNSPDHIINSRVSGQCSHAISSTTYLRTTYLRTTYLRDNISTNNISTNNISTRHHIYEQHIYEPHIYEQHIYETTYLRDNTHIHMVWTKKRISTKKEKNMLNRRACTWIPNKLYMLLSRDSTSIRWRRRYVNI